MIKIVNGASFEEEVLNCDMPVLVDFWAEWCPSCPKQLQQLEKFAQERKDIKICKIDADENAELASKLKVKGLPSILYFNKGELVCMKVGLTSTSNILKMMERI